MNKSLQHAGLSWEEAIRCESVTTSHILEMQEIIINQEGIIEDLETRVEETDRLLNSFDFETLNKELDWIEQCCDSDAQESFETITKIIYNFKSRKLK